MTWLINLSIFNISRIHSSSISFFKLLQIYQQFSNRFIEKKNLPVSVPMLLKLVLFKSQLCAIYTYMHTVSSFIKKSRTNHEIIIVTTSGLWKTGYMFFHFVWIYKLQTIWWEILISILFLDTIKTQIHESIKRRMLGQCDPRRYFFPILLFFSFFNLLKWVYTFF